MTNPNISQGTLKLQNVSVTFTDNTDLNVSASYLTPAGVELSFTNDAGVLVPTLVGATVALNAYQIGSIVIHLNKAQSLADDFKSQITTNANVGEVVIRGDSTTLSDYTFSPCVIQNVNAITFNNTTNEYAITLQGIYQINSDQWS